MAYFLMNCVPILYPMFIVLHCVHAKDFDGDYCVDISV